MNALGKSVRLFLADGTPGGLTTAEIMNWTGQVTAGPRSDLAALLRRSEVSRTGIYLLLGDDPENPGSTLAYIGEADDVGKRLAAHGRAEESGGKDFWDRVIVLTSKDMNLTKAHARYLESRFIAIAKGAGRARLSNGTGPDPLPLPEADVSDMEFFIEQAQIVLPVLGVNLLRSTRPSQPTGGPEPAIETPSSPVLTLTVRGTDATAQEVDGEFVVREGSLGRAEWMGVGRSYENLRTRLLADGALELTPDGKHARFTRDVVFDSPSAASAVVLARSSNGRLEWKVQGTGTTYGQWQESLVDESTTEDT